MFERPPAINLKSSGAVMGVRSPSQAVTRSESIPGSDLVIVSLS
jgi:hypothetical protein